MIHMKSSSFLNKKARDGLPGFRAYCFPTRQIKGATFSCDHVDPSVLIKRYFNVVFKKNPSSIDLAHRKSGSLLLKQVLCE